MPLSDRSTLGLYLESRTMNLFEIRQNGKWRVRVPAVTHRLKTVVLILKLARRLFRFGHKAGLQKIRPREKRIVRSLAPVAYHHAFFDPDLSLVRIRMLVMINIPSEGDPKAVEKILSHFGFLILRREIRRLILTKPCGKERNFFKC